MLSPAGEGHHVVRDYFGSRPSALQEQSALAEEEDEDDDNPLVPRLLRPAPQPSLLPLRRATLPILPRPDPVEEAEPEGFSQAAIELPPPPANALPAYSAHLAHDELRLISSVHLDQNHPAAAFFSAIATSVTRGEPGSQGTQDAEVTTGTKKLRLTLTRGGQRMNAHGGTGPVFVRLGRGGVIEGRIDVGKVDHAVGLEVAVRKEKLPKRSADGLVQVIGLCNTSYYIRGQYTLIDTMPLVRRLVILYPPSEPSDPASATTSTPAEGVGESSTAPGTMSTVQNPAQPSSALTNGKDPQAFLPPGQTFSFSIPMPTHHYRDENIELPPSCQVFQIGIQAGIEYVLRVKLSRKGWRLNET